MTSEEFIAKYRKVLGSGSAYFNPDTSYMPKDRFYTAKCRILVVFSTPIAQKTVSSTAAALNDYIIEHCPDTFVDFAYYPDSSEIKLYDKENIPYAVGYITHLDASHFDLVGFSISVLHENIVAPIIVKSFERCDNPIPTFWSQRKDSPLGTYPIIYCGGITSIYGDVMFGKVSDTEQAYLDFDYLGGCEKTNILTNRFIEAKETGLVHRKDSDRDIEGYPHEEWLPFTEECKVSTIQDYIECLFDLKNIYHPQAYDVKYNDKAMIISNKKVNAKARDFVSPYYPHEMSKDLGIGRTIINANGDGVGVSQVQVSEGCSAAGACSFMVSEDTKLWTDTGIKSIKDLVGYTGKVRGLLGQESFKRVQYVQDATAVNVYTKDGHLLKCDKNHKWFLANPHTNSWYVKTTSSLQPGDVVLRPLGSTEVTNPVITDPALGEFLGFMHGRGSLGKDTWQMFMDEGEVDHYSSLFERFVSSKSKPQVTYKSESTTIYVISGKPVDFGFDIVCSKSNCFHVPDCIFCSTKQVIASYLSGLFHATGWCNNCTPGLTSSSEQLIRDVSLLLQCLGIDSFISMNHPSKEDSYHAHKSWDLNISEEFQQRFVKLLGFYDNSHEVGFLSNRIKSILYNTELLQSQIIDLFPDIQSMRDKGLVDLGESSMHRISDRKFQFLNGDAEFQQGTPFDLVSRGLAVTDEIDVVQFTDEEIPMYDVVDTQTHFCAYGTILTHQCAEGNYCLPKGTLVKSTNGLTPIEEFKVGDKTMLNNDAYDVKDTVIVGEKPTITFTLSNGQTYKVANTHLILTPFDSALHFRRAYALQLGDFIAFERSKSFGSNNLSNTDLFAEVLHDSQRDSDSITIYKPSTPTSNIERIRKSIQDYDTLCPYTIQDLYSATKESVTMFLQSIFSIAGTIDVKNSLIHLGLSSKELAEDICKLLSMFGMLPTLTFSSYCYKKGIRYVEDKAFYGVNLSGLDIDIFRRDIGFLDDTKKNILSNLKVGMHNPVAPGLEGYIEYLLINSNIEFPSHIVSSIKNHVVLRRSDLQDISQLELPSPIQKSIQEITKYEYFKIEDIQFGDPELMFDINVENSHAYSLTGLVSHNTGGWVESDKETILKNSWESKKYSGAWKFKPFSFNMLPSDTIVPTGAGGFTRLSELSTGGTVLDCYGVESTIGGFLSTQKSVLYKFKLSRGLDAVMSDEHKQMVLTSNGLVWKKACDLKVGDWIPQNLGYYKSYLDEFKFDSKCYFLGLWFGDGCRDTPEWKRSIQCLNVNEKCLRAVCDTSSVFSHKGTYSCDNVIRYTYKQELTDFFKQIFPNYKYEDNKLLSLSISQLLSFTKGWFDADGCATTNKSNQLGLGSRFKVTFSEKEYGVARVIGTVLQSVGINFHLSPVVEVQLPGYNKVYRRRDLTITGLHSRKLFSKFIGFTELRKQDTIRTAPTKWSDKDKTLPSTFGVWVYNELSKLGDTSGYNVSKFFAGTKGLSEDRFEKLFSDIDIEPARVFKSGIRFSQIEAITIHNQETSCVDINEPRVNQFITEFGVTHNCNYLTDYKGMLAEWMKIYPKVTFINMRMEELGRDTDAINIMRYVGSQRISAPMEGVSPRVQNNFLNKCLSTESMENFMSELLHLHLTDIKVGGIFTGYEQDEDFQWLCDFVDKFKERAHKEGGSFPFRMNFTPLVHYALTPLEYLERKSARKSYAQEHWLTDFWYEKFREHDIHAKVNGFRYSTFLESCVVDMGRLLTPYVHKRFVEPLAAVYSLRNAATPEFIEDTKSLVSDPDVFFGDRHPAHYISPCHRVHIDLMGSYIARARRLVEAKQNGSVFDNPMDVRCLRTYSGAPVKCYHNAIKDKPLVTYNDVEMDSEGNLHGDAHLLLGCDRCGDNKERAKRLNKAQIETMNLQKIQALPRKERNFKVRFLLSRNADYDLLNPNNTAYTFLTKFLQHSDRILHAYHSLFNHNMFWSSEPQFKYFTAGMLLVDVFFAEDVIDEVRYLIPVVNSELIACKVISATPVLMDDKILIRDKNIFSFKTSLPKEILINAYHAKYDGSIRVMGGGQASVLELIQDKTLTKPQIITKGSMVYGTFELPMKYCPTEYFMGWIHSVKNVSMQSIIDTTTFKCEMAVRETSGVCSACGKEHRVISLASGKSLAYGVSCICKSLLLKM